MGYEKLIKDCGAFIEKCPNEKKHTIECEVCRMQYVREETIKEVFTWLPQALRELYASGKWVEWKDLAEKVKEKFGVEIKYEM